MTTLVLRGFRKPLTEQDCWELPHSEKTVTVVQQVQHTMDSRTTKGSAQKIQVNHTNDGDTSDSKPEQDTLLEPTSVVGIAVRSLFMLQYRMIIVPATENSPVLAHSISYVS